MGVLGAADAFPPVGVLAAAPRTRRPRQGGRGSIQCAVFLEQAITALSESGARYCVVGGVAVSLHGVPRTTYDLDIVVHPETETFVGTVGIAALMHFATGNVFGYAAFFALTFVTAGLQSVDGPTRLAIVPRDQTSGAQGLLTEIER